jgi:hypothetical protein
MVSKGRRGWSNRPGSPADLVHEMDFSGYMEKENYNAYSLPTYTLILTLGHEAHSTSPLVICDHPDVMLVVGCGKIT